jgi:hypothetical protein
LKEFFLFCYSSPFYVTDFYYLFLESYRDASHSIHLANGGRYENENVLADAERDPIKK